MSMGYVLIPCVKSYIMGFADGMEHYRRNLLMPMKSGSSDKTRQSNVKEMIASGHPPKQSVAAAYRQQRQSKRKKKK